MLADEDLGTIAGQVDESVITSLGGTTYTGSDIDTGCSAYVYAGHDVTVDDYYDDSPVTSTASVKYDTATSAYRYVVGAVVGGTESAPEAYTVAVTCDADDPETDDSLDFTAGQNADVVAGQTETADF
jgi:hypothetical protein